MARKGNSHVEPAPMSINGKNGTPWIRVSRSQIAVSHRLRCYRKILWFGKVYPKGKNIKNI